MNLAMIRTLGKEMNALDKRKQIKLIGDIKMNIQVSDRVLAISGHFEGKRGYVTRIYGESACIVWAGGWDFGIWVDLSELKRTKRYKKEQVAEKTQVEPIIDDK
jgi:hypothetical protein